jgi:predicted SnoaL-like aldol condensation-catalyzing enzyme
MLALLVLATSPVITRAQVPVIAADTADQFSMLGSSDPVLAANKKLVFDMWREFIEAGHLETAEKYFREDYIQHNPMVPTGRAAVVKAFAAFTKRQPVKPTISGKLVTILAERDLVTLAFVRELPDPKDPSKHYTTTWFDMFRIEDGKIAEHWDTATLP